MSEHSTLRPPLCAHRRRVLCSRGARRPRRRGQSVLSPSATLTDPCIAEPYRWSPLDTMSHLESLSAPCTCTVCTCKMYIDVRVTCAVHVTCHDVLSSQRRLLLLLFSRLDAVRSLEAGAGLPARPPPAAAACAQSADRTPTSPQLRLEPAPDLSPQQPTHALALRRPARISSLGRHSPLSLLPTKCCQHLSGLSVLFQHSGSCPARIQLRG